MDNLLIIIKTAQHRYAIRRDQLLDIKIAQTSHPLRPEGSPNHEYPGVELGPLLDPADRSSAKRYRVLVVPMRRRPIAFFVDEVETFLEHAICLALPDLLRERLQKPWVVGALIVEDALVLQLDLHAVARSALLGISS